MDDIPKEEWQLLVNALTAPIEQMIVVEAVGFDQMQEAKQRLQKLAGNRPVLNLEIKLGEEAPDALYKRAKHLVASAASELPLLIVSMDIDDDDSTREALAKYWRGMNQLRENWHSLTAQTLFLLTPIAYKHLTLNADHLKRWISLKVHLWSDFKDLAKIARPGLDVTVPYVLQAQLNDSLEDSGEAPQFDVFISYDPLSYQLKAAANKLIKMLEAEGVKVCKDLDESSWLDQPETALRLSKSLVVLIGSEQSFSQSLDFEIEYADRLRRPIIPVLLPGFQETFALPALLNNRSRIDLRAGFTQTALQRLIWGITGHMYRENLIQTLKSELGKADQKRLDDLIALRQEDGRIVLDGALKTLYPGQPLEAAGGAFRAFQQRLEEAAKEAQIELCLEFDRLSSEARIYFYLGDEAAVFKAGHYSEAEAQGEVRIAQDVIELTETREGKPLVRYFVSYARDDKALSDDLLKKLQQHLKCSADFYFEPWVDQGILPGEDWHGEIQKAIAQCHFGLLLISPAFLSSRYITQLELPQFVSSDPSELKSSKRAIPVALKPVRFDGSMDLKGLQAVQIYHDKEGKTFYERSGAKRDAFALSLFDQIIKAVKKNRMQPVPSVERSDALEQHNRCNLHDFERLHYTPNQGKSASMDKFLAELDKTDLSGERREAIDFLLEWLSNPQSQPYCALLGEYGMGKTTTCKALTQRLLENRKQKDWPLPIYLDLRHVGETAKQAPGLYKILETVVEKSWRGGDAKPILTADEIMRLVREEGALAIFDGLDEVLVHLSASAGQAFTRELFRLLPINLWHQAQEAKPGKALFDAKPGRLLFSCRTHYFRSLREQQTHFTAEGRDGVRASDYKAFVLLPFSEQQIIDYLQHSFPDENPERLMETLRSVHNLTELAERPYTLSLIAEQFSKIESWKLEGRVVTGVVLYKHMVESWLERDTGKHQLTKEHKQTLMERFAANLWASGRRSWSVDDVEQWLIDFFMAEPSIAAHYEGVSRELLKEDLRTATFLVREGDKSFRFAHTSLQEFFLASYLFRALLEGRVENWALPLVSPETLDFLGQLLQEEIESPGSLRESPVDNSLSLRERVGVRGFNETFKTLRDQYRPKASELALSYALRAWAKGYPSFNTQGFDLKGADLKGWEIQGKKDKPFDLSQAVLQDAHLNQAKLHYLNLDSADFSQADFTYAELRDSSAQDIRFDSTDLQGSLFRGLNGYRASFNHAHLKGTRWLNCNLTEAQSLDVQAMFALCRPESLNVFPPNPSILAALTGHNGEVNACAFSPDGLTIASASYDKTLRLWNAATGECSAILKGHEDSVLSCAFSPDGLTLASASEDKTLRLWNAATGECSAILKGHESDVLSCAFSPDGLKIVSASDDHTLRIWNTDSAECTALLKGHDSAVLSCAFSPDGLKIVSASKDDALRIWNTDSAECTAVLKGHKRWVTSCAFSPDGLKIVSASYDHTLRIWNTETAECTALLKGHDDSVTSSAFSPDGLTLLSASDDKSLRLWNADTGECSAILKGHDDYVHSCVFSPDGLKVVSASDDRSLRIWNTDSAECTATLKGHEYGVRSCAFSPDSLKIVMASSDDTLRIWNALTGECASLLKGHESAVWSCAFSPDGLKIVSASKDNTLRIWNAATGKCSAILKGHEGYVLSCVFSLDSLKIVSASSDDTLRIWNTDSGECTAVLKGHENVVWSCAFSPDGLKIVSASFDHTLRIWNTDSAECTALLKGHEGWVTSCAFSPDGLTLASASNDNTLRFWNAATGECSAILKGHRDWVTSCAFSPDGLTLASASNDNTLRFWNAATGECCAIFKGHEGAVLSCGFSPDGLKIVSASSDGSLRLWDVDTGVELRQWRMLDQDAWACIDIPANRIVKTGGEAWRWLAWQALDPVTHRLTRYPAEALGPLPSVDV